MAQLICFSDVSGMPIFSKSLDSSVKIPLPTATLLKTVSTKLSGEAGNDVVLLSAEAGGLSFYWKHTCHDLSYVLVVKEEVGMAHHMEILLTLVHHVMVMGLGKEKLGLIHSEVKKFTKSRNIDPPLNILLQCLSSCEVSTMADVIGYPDYSFPAHNQQEVNGVLSDFLSVSGARNGCLLFRSTIIAESKGWHTFSPTDAIVLILFAQSMGQSHTTHQEFINTTSGVKNLMVVTKLTDFISLITIMEHGNGDGSRLFEEAIQMKRKQKNTFLTHVEEEKCRATDSVDLFLNNVVHGALIIDHKEKKCWWATHPELRLYEVKKKMQLLRKFYKEAKQTMNHTALQISETYSSTLEAKFYALRQGNSECFLLLTSDVNHLQMREITKMVFRIVQDRLLLNQN